MTKQNLRMTHDRNLEPRVAKVETELESVVRDIGILTADVRSLAESVRVQGDSIGNQIQQLMVSVTAASGPRKTDWGTLISAIGLIMAIGASALSPLYLRVSDVQTAMSRIDADIHEHAKLKLHPVGESRVDAIEETIKDHLARLQKEVDQSAILLRTRIDEIERSFRDVKDNGSPITRERLAIIEEKLKNL